MRDGRALGIACGLGAALLFGASAPLAKLLLGGAGPLALASLLYLGAGGALGLVGVLRPRRDEAPLRRGDLPVMAGIIVCGGLVGPALMLFGLARLSGVTGALLLNLEAPFTMLLAVLVFREHLAGRELLAAAVIVAGGVLLERRPGELHADWIGVVCIAGACASWGLDNNLTQRLSVRDPVAVVRWKTLGAGSLMALVALLAGESFPAGATLAAALLVGALSYGVSLLLDTMALRLLGAAREAAIFASAPFAGAALAVPLLGETVRAVDVVAGTLMLAGVLLLARARHGHRHTHEILEHEHAHVHDEHHAHAHDGPGPVGEPHTHLHRHDAITHEHPHVSDVHHRHRH